MKVPYLEDAGEWSIFDIPDWYDPEDEGSEIAACLYGVAKAVESIPEDAVFHCPVRYSTKS